MCNVYIGIYNNSIGLYLSIVYYIIVITYERDIFKIGIIYNVSNCVYYKFENV